MPSSNVEDFHDVLSSSKSILIVSGAGLSAASGIATFRGTGGRWRKYDPKVLATLSAWQENQSRVWQFFHYRREEVRPAQPNKGHHVLAQILMPSLRKGVAPNTTTVTHVTQNIDGLLSSASGKEPDGQIIEMHGNLFDVVCTAHDCDYRVKNTDNPICLALGGTEVIVGEGNVEPVVKRVDLPHCPKCQQLLRPDVVWFGERPKRIQEILQIADSADLCLVVGTSSLVQPASKLHERVRANGGKVAVFNMEVVNHSDEADFLFLGPCEVELERVLGM
ncbi:DHS-like NAD/FAD-binding domain-containing protein [Dendrothele bispora CBS 962.96]|uniref:DHS-like NAD/FAD-binding domain-containing protein n=1 Tax=Dendrothele bispora (strain CBS 962.96) TaxID=1314807 RepID=A0A4S8LDZ4_DENBC|nr:DHS-like NAD/FAD-binding domain-containing protein [Dendrothele bispora CBS 962.96]